MIGKPSFETIFIFNKQNTTPMQEQPSRHNRPIGGFTLLELIISMAIIAILTAISVPGILQVTHFSKVEQAKADVKLLEQAIINYLDANGELPDSLDDIGYGDYRDPWGNPYQYLRIDGGNARRGQMRKDHFMVPVNSDFDLYSMGEDGRSASPFTSALSQDDIVRARDGSFVGLVSDY